MESYTVKWTQTGRDFLADIHSKSVRRQLLSASEKLSQRPNEQGKALSSPLSGFRSVSAVGARYRIIYRVLEGSKTVEVIAVGMRNPQDENADVYARTSRTLRSN